MRLSNCQAPDIPDLRDFHPREAATALRAYWKIRERPIGNMVHLLEAKGARVYSLAEQCRRLDAFSLWYCSPSEHFGQNPLKN